MNKRANLFFIRRIHFSLFLACFLGLVLLFSIFPNQTNADTQEDLKNQIQNYENKINSLQGTERSLSSRISEIEYQTKITNLKINLTKNQIEEVENDMTSTSNKISRLELSLDKLGGVFLERISSSYKVGMSNPLQLFFSSKNLSEIITKESYLKVVRNHDRQLMIQVQMSKENFTEQKQMLEDKQNKLKTLQSQLESYTKQLASEEKNKKALLSQTQGSEATYQRLLSQARAQLAGFSNFVENQGGASILSGQTSCNDWGCYYNQRDSQWGNTSLNHTQYTIASDGCLVTSMAIVLSHYGHRVTPLDINSNPSNFASYYPAFLLYTISAGGVTASRLGATIDSQLSSNNPVIVGVHAYGGTHFIVLLSGSGGNYKMHDPFLENGKNISFTDHYSMGSIFEVDKVIVQ